MPKTKLGNLGLTADILNGTIIGADLQGGNPDTAGKVLASALNGTLSWVANDDTGEDNQNAFSSIALTGNTGSGSGTPVVADAASSSLGLVGGTDIELTGDTTNDTITIDFTGTVAVADASITGGAAAAGVKIAANTITSENLAANSVGASEVGHSYLAPGAQTAAWGLTFGAYHGATLTMEGAESNNRREVLVGMKADVLGASIDLDNDDYGLVARVIVSDSATSMSPSQTATLENLSGESTTLIDGAGTATAYIKQSPAGDTNEGDFNFDVLETTSSVSRYLWISPGPGSVYPFAVHVSQLVVTFS
jgi:hypothetical protein